MVRKYKLKNLNISPELEEIRGLDWKTVYRYSQNMEEGCEFPPITFDTEYNVIVDGMYRKKAYDTVYSPETSITVNTIKCSSWDDLVYTFGKLNSQNAKPLSAYSCKKIVTILSQYNWTKTQIAQLFNVPVIQIDRWSGEHIVQIGSNIIQKPVKGGIKRKNKPPITEENYIKHDKHHKGEPTITLVDQLIDYINNNWIDLENEKEVQKLQELHKKLTEIL